MTNDQALQEAQTRVDSFREQAKEWMTSPPLRSQANAITAIETEIKTVKECWTKTEDTAFLSEKFHNLKLILEQIPNTL